MKRNVCMNNRKIKSFVLAVLVLSLVCSLTGCSFEVESIAPAAETAAPTEAPAPVTAAQPEPSPTAEPEEEPVAEEPAEEVIEGELLLDEDGDGIINYSFNYKGAKVYAMFILDPSRVYLGTAVREAGVMWGGGKTLDVFLDEYGAAAGMNAGVFDDQDGAGSGWPPTGITVGQGEYYNTVESGPVAGFNGANQLFAGYYTFDDCNLTGLRDAVSFGPVYVSGGEKIDPNSLESGIGARSCIGQRADGTVVFMVADGRQGYSIGLRLQDVADIMYDKFECVTAVNMDGGNSSCMAFGDALVNNPSNQAGGTRSLPTAWLVKPLESGYKKPESVPERVILPKAEETELQPCGEEMYGAMMSFADEFTEAYYGFFGTPFADMYFPQLCWYVPDGCELRARMQEALMDRKWVNSHQNVLTNKSFDGAYDNGDGSYTIEYTLDIVEYATYWTYEAPQTHLKIIVVPNDAAPYGYYAIATY